MPQASSSSDLESLDLQNCVADDAGVSYDATMNDAAAESSSPTASDLEYISDDPDTDSEDDAADSGDEAIDELVPQDSEYGDYEQRDIFDDGVTDDALSEEDSLSDSLAGPEIAQPLLKSFVEVEDLVMSRRKNQERLEVQKWELLELEEQNHKIEQQIQVGKVRLEEAAADDIAEQAEFEAALEISGMSLPLFEKYEAFCKSLNPQFGQRGGFSITCDAPHDESYVTYDPEFELFKEFVEMPYNSCNFRSEASRVTLGEKPHKIHKDEQTGPKENIVEFWPIQCPEPLTGGESTWGEQYLELYELATNPARNGFELAMGMLVSLPDIDSSFNGGWLFEYKRDPRLQESFVVAQRWKYHSAHKIDVPVTVEEKRRQLELMLRPENAH